MVATNSSGVYLVFDTHERRATLQTSEGPANETIENYVILGDGGNGYRKV
jgi:hypothetical protein